MALTDADIESIATAVASKLEVIKGRKRIADIVRIVAATLDHTDGQAG